MKDFKRYFMIPASKEQVYLALTNPATIQLWSGETAEMSTIPGSEFSLWDGSINGVNVQFEQDNKIVQEWYFGESTEKSIVTIKLFDDKHGTSMEVRQTNIPMDDYLNIEEGWVDSYAGGLIAFFEEMN